MNINADRRFRFLLAGVVICAILGCSKQDRAPLTVQLCLNNDDGVVLFKNILLDESKKRGYKFIDQSRDTKNNLDAIKSNGARIDVNSIVINSAVEKSGENILLASNLGLPDYEVAIGFGKNKEEDKVNNFSKEIIDKISKYWKVTLLPDGIATRIEGCPTKS